MKLIKKIAAKFEESAPDTCVLGIKVSVISVLVAVAGYIEDITIGSGIGYVMGVCGIFSSFIGMAIYFKGYFRQSIAKKEHEDTVAERINNPKHPWE